MGTEIKAMAHYRICTLNHEGHVASSADADCASDEAVFAYAATALAGC
jgi:hypothetical protein